MKNSRETVNHWFTDIHWANEIVKNDHLKVIEWSFITKGHVIGHLKNQIKSKGFYQLCKSKGFFATHLYSVLAVYLSP